MKYLNDFEKNSSILSALKDFFTICEKCGLRARKTNGLKEHIHSDRLIIKELKVAIGKSKLHTLSENRCHLILSYIDMLC